MAWSGDVYQCLQCHKAYLPEFGPIQCPRCCSRAREKTGTIEDPVKFLQDLINDYQGDVIDRLGELRGPDRCDVCHEVATATFYQGSQGQFHAYCAEHFRQHRDEDFICEPTSQSEPSSSPSR